MGTAGDKKKAPKGAPKLKRAGRHSGKYAVQFKQTYRNKLRRVMKHNGPEAAREYETKFAMIKLGRVE